MALDKMRSVDLRIDKANDYLVTKLLSKQGDYNGRELIVQITNGGVVENQITTQMNLGWRHLKYGNSGLDPFKLIDADKGLFGISYSEEMLRTGDVLCTVQIIQGGKLTETRNFNLEVEESPINKKLMVTQDSFKALEKALTQVNEWDGKFESKYAGLEEEYALELTTLKQETTAQFQQNEKQLAQTDLKLNNKANQMFVDTMQTYFDNKLKSIIDGSPKGVEPTFESLKLKYPTKTSGVYVVSSDNNWYFWLDGFGWTSGGVYQIQQLSDNSVTSKKTTNLGLWGTIFGAKPPNINFETNMLEIRTPAGETTINYKNNYDVLARTIDIPLTDNSGVNRTMIVYNTESKKFRTVLTNVSTLYESEIIVAIIRMGSKQGVMLGEYTVNGDPVGSDGATPIFDFGLDSFYYRDELPIIENVLKKIIFPKKIKITYIKKNLFLESIVLAEPVSFDWKHNVSIYYDVEKKELGSNLYPEKLNERTQFVLFRNIDNKLVSGHMKSQYDYDVLNKTIKELEVNTVSDTKHTQKGVGNYAAVNTILTTNLTPNGAVCVKDEYWAFYASNDANTNYNKCSIYTINPLTFELTLSREFEHNWGHVNSISYNKNNDSLIFGNGSGDYAQSGKFYIIPKVSELNTNSTKLDIQSAAIAIDLSLVGYGAKVNAVWGRPNGKLNNIACLLSNDNKNVREIFLGMGSNNLGLGSFVDGKMTNEFNGSFKLLNSYSQSNGIEVIQGADISDDGFIYVGLGHDGIWYVKQSLNSDGSITKEEVKSVFYGMNGVALPDFTESISCYKDKLFLRITDYGTKETVYVLNR